MPVHAPSRRPAVVVSASLLRLSAGVRVAIALALSALLWLAVLWALT